MIRESPPRVPVSELLIALLLVVIAVATAVHVARDVAHERELRSHPPRPQTYNGNIANRQRLLGQTAYSIDAVSQSASYVNVVGWAVDHSNHALALAVTGRIDNGPFDVAAYGMRRADVAAALGSQGYVFSGFRLRIPAAGLRRGKHQIELRIYAADNSGYYEVGPRAIQL